MGIDFQAEAIALIKASTWGISFQCKNCDSGRRMRAGGLVDIDLFSQEIGRTGGSATVTVHASYATTSRPAVNNFHAQAYDELKAKTRDRELWARAIADSEGDRARAISQYIRERAQALQAQAESATPTAPDKVWDHRTGAEPLPVKSRDVGVWVGWALIIAMMVLYAVIIQ